MIGIGRTIQVHGDPLEAMAYAQDMVAHIKTWPNVDNVRCWLSLAGPTGTFTFWFECADLAASAMVRDHMMGDTAYWAKIKAAREAGLFDTTTSVDLMMQQIA